MRKLRLPPAVSFFDLSDELQAFALIKIEQCKTDWPVTMANYKYPNEHFYFYPHDEKSVTVKMKEHLVDFPAEHSHRAKAYFDNLKVKQAKAKLKEDMQNARLVARYFDIYRTFLQDNNLDDDSKSISVSDLIDFVNTEIEEEEKNDLLRKSRV